MAERYPRLSEAPFVVADTETTGLNWRVDRVFGVSIALPDGTANYYDVRREQDRNYVAHELPKARKVVNHHIKFDIHMLRESRLGIDPARCRCTMIAAALLDEHEMSYSLDALARKYVGMSKEDIWPELARMFGGEATRKAQIGNLHRAPVELAARYANQDVLATLALYRHQVKEIMAQELQEAYRLEHNLLPVLVEMERHGVRVDVDRAELAVEQLSVRLAAHQSSLDKLAGRPVNANSPPQVKALLLSSDRGPNGEFLAIDGTHLNATDSGNASMDGDTLRKVNHPIAREVLAVRGLDKTINTFLKGHILGNQIGGRVHCNYNQTKSDNDRGTGTGRLSVDSPALQQIHKRDKDLASIVRACFIPDEDQAWASLDWSQMDFRIFAHFANDPAIMAVYAKNPFADFHGEVAAITNLPRDRTPGTGGGNAKQINLGLVFGMQPGRMAAEMGLPFTVENTPSGHKWMKPGPEAMGVFEKYHAAIPGVNRLLDHARNVASRRHYVRTASPVRRRIRFPGGKFTHKAAGLMFQGTAADALKHKLVEIHKIVTGTEAKLLINVHDEFDLSVPWGGAGDSILREITAEIERFGPGDYMPLRVPIRSSCGRAHNWWEASNGKNDMEGLRSEPGEYLAKGSR